MIGPQPLCAACKRFGTDFEKGPVCSAFPDGIPERIYRDGFDHRQPFPGDGGTRFVRDPDLPLPEGFAEDVEPTEPVFITKPPPIRHQTSAELRSTAKKMIDALRNHPDR